MTVPNALKHLAGKDDYMPEASEPLDITDVPLLKEEDVRMILEGMKPREGENYKVREGGITSEGALLSLSSTDDARIERV